MKRLVAALAILAAAWTAALAQSLPYTYPRTVGTSSTAVLPANVARKRVMFINPNSVAVLYLCPAISRVDSSAITCVANGAGSIPLLPSKAFLLDGVGGNPALPSAWNAVSDTGSSKLTILEWE